MYFKCFEVFLNQRENIFRKTLMKKQKKEVDFSGSWQMSPNVFFYMKGRSKFYVDGNVSIWLILMLYYVASLQKMLNFSLKILKTNEIVFCWDYLRQVNPISLQKLDRVISEGLMSSAVLGLYPSVSYFSHSIVWKRTNNGILAISMIAFAHWVRLLCPHISWNLQGTAIWRRDAYDIYKYACK